MDINSTETNGEIQTDSKPRRVFLRRTIIGAAVAVPTIALAGTALKTLTPTPASAAAAANFDPLDLYQAFLEIQGDENAHVAFLQQALTEAGVQPRPKPTFKNLKKNHFKDFELLATTFENVGVGAYLMAAPAISSKEYLAAAASILTIEARHAGYLDSLVGDPLSPNGHFDKPISQAQIVQDVSPYIKSLNGGSDPSAPLTSDVDILNFALLLEYLEAEFYNTNIPKFF